MKFFVLSQVAAVLIVGLALRRLCAHQGIGQNQLLLIDGAVVALALAALAYGLNRLLTPYELIRRRVAEAVRAKTPRSVTVDGFAPQRDLAREVDTLMRLLEERMEDPNLGPVYLPVASSEQTRLSKTPCLVTTPSSRARSASPRSSPTASRRRQSPPTPSSTRSRRTNPFGSCSSAMSRRFAKQTEPMR